LHVYPFFLSWLRYKIDDLKHTKIENAKIKGGYIEECTLGLEDRSITAVRHVIRAVLREQKKQKEWGIDNKEKILSTSLRFSKESRQYANERASMVETDVKSLYQEADTRPNVKKNRRSLHQGACFAMRQLKGSIKKKVVVLQK